eukprot:TRINITY_DN61609_c0_g1_i1.p1 TRINITY_DN61609_c0_g1~~TRINITY_DN61609_c0_g1_i1.p1  ORF type:complete len:116 (+),score=23.00 TRINITY_DN61609_c0_g1_i1:62-409(+)
MSGSQAGTQPQPTTQTSAEIGVQGIVKQFQAKASSDISAGTSLGPQTASTGMRSAAASDIAELANKTKKKQTTYLCTDCNEETQLTHADPVRCQSCGNRILYKKRGDVPVQYEAR